ncbi:MAG TPA: site-specific DNA-methyltransferase [Acetobacteraceae bacterium]|nr:site-specific DNA-methyltransferase [Acetobacteraceae bacterium]
MTVRILTGDCREVMEAEGPFDLIIADPPYADTSLAWDRKVHGWLKVAARSLKPTGSIWVFGSMRSLIGSSSEIARARLRYAQDIVWEKHNGSGFAADRFKRVHEHAVQFYRADALWSGVFNDVQRGVRTGPPKSKKAARQLPAHVNAIADVPYDDDGSRILRSVIMPPSIRGRTIHPTEKPSALLEVLVRTSCPVGGLVGDFFAGSGAAGEACAMTGRHYVGCEIDAGMADKARGRLGSLLFGAAA